MEKVWIALDDRTKGLHAVARYVPASVYAEMNRWYRAKMGSRFHLPVIEEFLGRNKLEVVPFTRDHADALVEWTAKTLGGEADYQTWKRKKAVTHLRRLLERQELSDVDALLTACEDANARKVPSTVDWLMVGTALSQDLTLVTNEKRRGMSEFKGLPRVRTLAELEADLGLSP